MMGCTRLEVSGRMGALKKGFDGASTSESAIISGMGGEEKKKKRKKRKRRKERKKRRRKVFL